VAAILADTPTVLWEATTAYIDLSTAFFGALSLAWMLRYAAGGSLTALALAALFCGLAVNTMTLALLALVPLVAIAFAGAGYPSRSERGPQSRSRRSPSCPR
jgi:hypothetical protein